jgi:hypothetical protein
MFFYFKKIMIKTGISSNFKVANKHEMNLYKELSQSENILNFDESLQ